MRKYLRIKNNSSLCQRFLSQQKGSILIVSLVFMTIFLTMAVGILGFVGLQHKLSLVKAAEEEALQIAEAGINYYRWHLAHEPKDFEDGTEGPGPYRHDYKDPWGDVIGQFELTIAPPQGCSSVVKIKSTGWLNKYPKQKRTIEVRYGLPSLAEYSFITNSNIWFGEEEEVSGKMHGNGGIRMDGEQDSVFTSTKKTYICGREHGCNNEEKPGIWGEGKGQEQGLWDFPEVGINFEDITLDLAELKTIAQTQGVYLEPSQNYGYHLNFQEDGTLNIYKVTGLKPAVWGWNGETKGLTKEANDLAQELFLKSYSLPIQTCNASNLIFVEDKLWVDGAVGGRATVAAARFPDTPETNASIIINGNITYPEPKTAVLGLIAQKDILIPLYSPDKLEIDAILLAQKGHVMRYYYPSNYSPWHLRNSIEVRGAIITNKIWTWSWVSGDNIISGYKETESSYDSKLIYYPPPFFPVKGVEYKFISWEEIQ